MCIAGPRQRPTRLFDAGAVWEDSLSAPRAKMLGHFHHGRLSRATSRRSTSAPRVSSRTPCREPISSTARPQARYWRGGFSPPRRQRDWRPSTLQCPEGMSGPGTGRLTIMVGGERADFEAVRPLLELMGATVMLQGGPGSGQHTKMANQIAIAGNSRGSGRGGDLREGRGPRPADGASEHRLGLGRKLAAQQHGPPDARRQLRARLLCPSISSRTCASPSSPRAR